MNIQELDEKLVGWRSARDIEKNSTAEAQHNCFLEELEEFKDAIGDMVVCLLNERSITKSDSIKESCRKIIHIIGDSCNHMGVNFNECLDIAWAEIEHRVGLTRSTGKFTKWRDLTHQERIEVVKSGQLSKAPNKILVECQEICTDAEWAELSAIEAETNGL